MTAASSGARSLQIPATGVVGSMACSMRMWSNPAIARQVRLVPVADVRSPGGEWARPDFDSQSGRALFGVRAPMASMLPSVSTPPVRTVSLQQEPRLMANPHVENREVTTPRITDKDEVRGSSPRGPTPEPPVNISLLGVSLSSMRVAFARCMHVPGGLTPRNGWRTSDQRSGRPQPPTRRHCDGRVYSPSSVTRR